MISLIYWKKAIGISEDEWREIAQIPEVREKWHLPKGFPACRLAAQVSGVKLCFPKEVAHKLGPVYVLRDRANSADLFLLMRGDQALVVCP